MDIKWIKTFIIAAKHENFRKASEELFLTQPAVTKHVKRLEAHLQITLFKKAGKMVKLTAAGHKFLSYAKELLASYETGLANFELWKQGYSRKLVLAVAPQIASSFLPNLLRKFMKLNPDIEILINVRNSFEIGEEISSGNADIGLTRLEPLQKNLHTEVLHKEDVTLVGPANRQLSEEDALNQYRLITNNHPEYWEDLLMDIKIYFPLIQTMEVNQMEVTKKFIENGLGVSYLPKSIAGDEVRQGKLREITAEKIITPLSYTYITTKIETAEVSEFIYFLRRALSEINS
ncbi:LysR family transcriptional regulator [Gracilibacillus oryzae]|uniref:LysR family transcriptional regulator n=1 Tax=Gracilibacillus oryzae TaxID=1672701 RepID=A0A7C8L2D8_9BACI|nr:LysR family transcriptional regulator [Gracilibacillus oryzae]KAB8129359.1 LysR family transcriptional regulator [Gracilibacillus oryzae]